MGGDISYTSTSAHLLYMMLFKMFNSHFIREKLISLKNTIFGSEGMLLKPWGTLLAVKSSK